MINGKIELDDHEGCKTCYREMGFCIILVESGEYSDRNEAVRTGVRELLEKHEQAGCTA